MPFVTDTFTDTDFVAVTSHTGETGASWTGAPVDTGSTGYDILSNQLRNLAGTWSLFYASGVPATAEYDVEADFVCGTMDNTRTSYTGIAGRMDTVADTFYVAWYREPEEEWELLQRVAGSDTSLGTYPQVLSNNTTYRVKLEIRDGTKKVFIDDVERISSSTNAITGAGRAGIGGYSEDAASGTAGILFDNFEANDVGGGLSIPVAMHHYNMMRRR